MNIMQETLYSGVIREAVAVRLENQREHIFLFTAWIRIWKQLSTRKTGQSFTDGTNLSCQNKLLAENTNFYGLYHRVIK